MKTQDFKKEEIYLDLWELTKEQQKEVIGMLPDPLSGGQYRICMEYNILIYSENLKCWITFSFKPSFRKEVTYEEFKTIIATEL